MEDNNKILIPGAVIVAGIIIAGAVIYSNNSGGDIAINAPTEDEAQIEALREATKNMIPVGERDYVQGDGIDAKIVLVEYSDFECPYCQRFHDTAQQLIDENEEVSWVYRHFPLILIHQQAFPAALAAECVARLGGNDAFWEFADIVFASQKQMSTNLYNQIATDMDIDVVEFADCQQNETTIARIQEDLDNVTEIGGTGTPFTLLVVQSGISKDAKKTIETLSEGFSQPGRPPSIIVAQDQNIVIVSGAQNIEIMRQIVDALL